MWSYFEIEKKMSAQKAPEPLCIHHFVGSQWLTKDSLLWLKNLFMNTVWATGEAEPSHGWSRAKPPSRGSPWIAVDRRGLPWIAVDRTGLHWLAGVSLNSLLWLRLACFDWIACIMNTKSSKDSQNRAFARWIGSARFYEWPLITSASRVT